MKNKKVTVIGAGLAGTEAAWQLANAGVPVRLFEMRPAIFSPAHHSEEFGELVCSNSFGALSPDRAAGLLHAELRLFNSLIIKTADNFSVPAGGALAVDRSKFSKTLTDKLSAVLIINEFNSLNSACSKPAALSGLNAPKLLLQTNSPNSSEWWAGEDIEGLISNNLTGTPALANCQAASVPARPAPITVTLLFANELIIFKYYKQFLKIVY